MTTRVAIVDPASWSLAYDVPFAEALARAGCEVTVHCAHSPHVGLPESHVPGVTVRELFYRRKYALPMPLPRRAVRAMKHPVDVSKLVRRLLREADVVHVQWLPGRASDVRAWAWLAERVPVTFTAHNAQEREEAIDPRRLTGFSAVIAHSQGGAERLRAAGIEDVWRMRIGAYGQYARVADPDVPPVELPIDAPLVVLPGLLRPYKGADLLLEAWPQVRHRIPDAQLVIAGRPMGVELPAVAPDGATFVPRFLDEAELGWLLRRADLCCLPYRKIDMSGIAVSALACGTPLLLSDVGGFDEYVGRGAQLVPPDDVGALTDALVELLEDPLRLEQLGAEARAAVRGELGWDAIAAEYVTRYKSLRGAPGAPARRGAP